MPTRLIKEDICCSHSLMSVSSFAERLFFRLLVKSDDYGRFDADPMIVRSRCFERCGDDISVKMVRQWLNELAKPAPGEQIGMIVFYKSDGKDYGKFLSMEKHNRKRAKYSRYPEPNGTFYHSLDDLKKAPDNSPSVEEKQKTQKRSQGEKENKPFDEKTDPKAFGCSDYLRESLISVKPDHALANKTDQEWKESKQRIVWARAFERCNRLDKRTWERINLVLSWLKNDEFWSKVVQSGTKFRTQFDRLESEMKINRNRSKNIKSGDVDMNDPSWGKTA